MTRHDLPPDARPDDRHAPPDLRVASEHAKALSEVASALSGATTPEAVFDELARVTRVLLGAAGLALHTLDAGRPTLIYRVGAMADADTPLPPPQLATLLAGQEVRDTCTTRAVEVTDSVHSGMVARLPLRIAGAIVGALTIWWSGARDLSSVDRTLLRDLSTHAAIALRNAQLLERERRLRLVAEASATIAHCALDAAPDGSCIPRALMALAEAIHASGVAVGVVDPESQVVHYRSASGTLVALGGTAAPRAESLLALTPGSRQGSREGPLLPAGTVVRVLAVQERPIGLLLVAPGAVGEVDPEALDRLIPAVALAVDVVLLNEADGGRRARERMLATALDTMEQAVVIVTMDRQVRYANPAALALYGYTASEFLLSPFDELVLAGAPARRLGGVAGAEGFAAWGIEHVHRRRDGSTFAASMHLSFIRDTSDTPIGQVVVVRDHTDERRVAEQLRQSEKLVALGELVAGVAHELNNPLAGISAFAQLLLDEPLGLDQADSVRLIKREADRAVSVIRDLLLFSRKSGPSRTPIDVNDMVEHTLRLRGYSLRSAGIDVRMDLAPSLPRVSGDLQRLQQVLLNLVINAEHALQGTEHRQLMVRSERIEEGVVLSVTDSGVGMTEETRQRIFEPFFTTKPVGEGTGLGLSVSYGIVRAHGGDIEVSSRPGEGTTFRVLLPLEATAARDVA